MYKCIKEHMDINTKIPVAPSAFPTGETVPIREIPERNQKTGSLTLLLFDSGDLSCIWLGD